MLKEQEIKEIICKIYEKLKVAVAVYVTHDDSETFQIEIYDDQYSKEVYMTILIIDSKISNRQHLVISYVILKDNAMDSFDSVLFSDLDVVNINYIETALKKIIKVYFINNPKI